jgi:hypothetical protein
MPATDLGVTIDAADPARVKADIAALRGKADVVVVSHHKAVEGQGVVLLGPPATGRRTRPSR